MTEDMTFCQNGLEECQVTRCERHPSNIENPQLPHSYAKLYRTEDCPLEKPQPMRWIPISPMKGGWTEQWACSKCGGVVTLGCCVQDLDYSFCPWCGEREGSQDG